MHYAVNEYNVDGSVFLREQHGVFSTISHALDWLADNIHFRPLVTSPDGWVNTLSSTTNVVLIVPVERQIWV